MRWKEKAGRGATAGSGRAVWIPRLSLGKGIATATALPLASPPFNRLHHPDFARLAVSISTAAAAEAARQAAGCRRRTRRPPLILPITSDRSTPPPLPLRPIQPRGCRLADSF